MQLHPTFSLFGKDVPFYGVLFFTGLLVAAFVAFALCRKRAVERFDIVCAEVYAGIGGILGAKLLFLLVSIPLIIKYKPDFLSLIKGGFVFYGGAIGGAAGLWIYCKQFHLPAVDYFDLAAVVVPLGHAFGRVGCFLSGCCYGMPYDGFGSYTYYEALDVNTPIGVPLLPIQLIESVCLLLLFCVQLALFLRSPDRKWRPTVVYLTVYPILRFVLEFFRGDAVRGGFLGLSTSQWISLLLLLGMAVLFLVRKRKKPTAELS